MNQWILLVMGELYGVEGEDEGNAHQPQAMVLCQSNLFVNQAHQPKQKIQN